jgi:soluble cytochrome b562
MTCCLSKSLFLPIALVVGLGGLAFVATSAKASDPAPSSAPAASSRWVADGGGPLEEAMESMKAGMKRLGREIGAKDAAAWKTLSGMQAAILKAKDQEPPILKTKPEAERAAVLAGYRAMMAQTLAVTCKLEQEILAGKWEEANKTLTDELRPMEKKGHNEYKGD